MTGNDGADVYTGGAGADDTVLEDSTGITVATADVVTDFVSGTDTISQTSGAGYEGNAVVHQSQALQVNGCRSVFYQ